MYGWIVSMEAELLEAISEGSEERAHKALAKGARVDTIDRYGLSPLHHAATSRNSIIVSLLLAQHGANPNPQNRTKRTPLHLAAEANDPDIIQILLLNGASVNAEDAYEWTPLHDAASAGSTQAAICLLEAGANVSKLSKDGLTPHEVAKKWGHEALAPYLSRVFTGKSQYTQYPSRQDFTSGGINAFSE